MANFKLILVLSLALAGRQAYAGDTRPNRKECENATNEFRFAQTAIDDLNECKSDCITSNPMSNTEFSQCMACHSRANMNNAGDIGRAIEAANSDLSAKKAVYVKACLPANSASTPAGKATDPSAAFAESSRDCGTIARYKGTNSDCQRAVDETTSAKDTLTAASTISNVGIAGYAQVSASKTTGNAADALKTQEKTGYVLGFAKLAEAALNLQKSMSLKAVADNAQKEADDADAVRAAIDDNKGPAGDPAAMADAALKAKVDKSNKDIAIKAHDGLMAAAAGNDTSGSSSRYGNTVSLQNAYDDSQSAADNARKLAKLAQTSAIGSALMGVTGIMGARQAGQAAAQLANATTATTTTLPPLGFTNFTGSSLVPGGNPTATTGANPTTFGGGYTAPDGSSGTLANAKPAGIGGGLMDSGAAGGTSGFTPAKIADSAAGGGGGLGGGAGAPGGAKAGGGGGHARGGYGSTGVGVMSSGPGGAAGSVAAPGAKGANAMEDFTKLFGDLLGKDGSKGDISAVTGEIGSRGLASSGHATEAAIYPEDINIFEQVSARYKSLNQGGRL